MISEATGSQPADKAVQQPSATTSADDEESPVPARQPAQEKLAQVQGEREEDFFLKRTASDGSIDRTKVPGIRSSNRPPASSDGSPRSARHTSVGQRPSSARTPQRRQQPQLPRAQPKSTHPLAVTSTPQSSNESAQQRTVNRESRPSAGDEVISEEAEEVCEEQQSDEGERSRTRSEGKIERYRIKPAGAPALRNTRHSSLSGANQRPSSASTAVGPRQQRKPRSMKSLPVAKPVSGQRSRAAR